jgi:5-methylcytosine-specific restriction endonuclease McrA
MGAHRIEGTMLITRRSARDQILLAWDYRCAYCGAELGAKPTIDHVVPKACGGLTVPNNLVACCMACNASKGHRPWREWLREQPFRSALGEWAIVQWLAS